MNSNLIRDQLYEPQRKLYDRIMASFANNEPVAVCAGQRSGKTTIEMALALDHEHVIVATGLTLNHTRSCFDDLRRLYGKKVEVEYAPNFFGNPQSPGRYPYKKVTPDTLVILDEPYWWMTEIAVLSHEQAQKDKEQPTPPYPEHFFERVCGLTKRVLAMGSRGPAIFKNTPMSCYPTWELNTEITRQMLEPEFVFDHDAATRDFGG